MSARQRGPTVVQHWAGRGWALALALGLAACTTPSGKGESQTPGKGKASEGDAASRSPRPQTIAAGAGHTCVLRESGAVACWGANASGQLGDGTTVDRSTPVTVQGLGDAVQLALGRNHGCARRKSGLVVCWGANDKGQLGNGGDVASLRPSPVRGITDAVSIAVGDDHGCALRANQAVVCWGNNRDGQLGNLTRNSWTEPAQIRGLADATALVAGSRHTCALRQTGGAICWGANDQGQLGDGTTNGHERPSAVADLTGLVGLAAAGSRTCGFTPQAVYCWGELDRQSTPRPRKVAERSNADNIAELELGPGHACMRQQSGTVRCWGQNRDGRLGDGSFDDRAQPVALALTAVTDLALGQRHGCALRSDAKVLCWGDDAGGALGRGDDHDSGQARDGVQRVIDLGDAIELAAGDEFNCAVRKSGEVSCWGRNDRGQLGDGSKDEKRAMPGPIAGIDDGVAITAAGAQACVVRRSGAVLCWGANDKGQLGRPAGTALIRPAPIAGLDDAVGVSLGAEHGCAVRRSGAVYCWGSDATGQLGDGAGSRGGKVAALVDAVALSSGRAHTCALRRSGMVSCWGANENGQIGNGVGAAQLKQPVHVPTAVAKLDDASEIAMGPDHGCARKRDGKAVCWGRNDADQLGSGTASNVWTSRVPVKDLANISALAVGPVHACATMGQRIACWGDNGAGQAGFVGPSAATPRVGVQGFDVASLALGRTHSCARLRSGEVACWGSNDHGQLGDGGRTISPTPTEVVGL